MNAPAAAGTAVRSVPQQATAAYSTEQRRAAVRPRARPATAAGEAGRSDPVLVGGYRLVAPLGTGGMADVFTAVSPTGEVVAVKILRAVAGAPPTCGREFRLTRAAGPDVTAPALCHGLSAAGAYLVTAYLPDHRCATELAGDAMPADQLLAFGSALSRALATIHARGVVHRDVKPANLLLRGDDLRLIDFGIARYVDEPRQDDGTVRCSPSWAAPEQRLGAPETAAVDVFAWGCVLAALATGRHPGPDDDDAQQAWADRSASWSTAPAALRALIHAALAADPVDRPSARQLATNCTDQRTASRRMILSGFVDRSDAGVHRLPPLPAVLPQTR